MLITGTTTTIPVKTASAEANCSAARQAIGRGSLKRLGSTGRRESAVRPIAPRSSKRAAASALAAVRG
jgi:hypothetical protein